MRAVYIGTKLGLLTVIGPKTWKGRLSYWPCRCSCGTERLFRQDVLRRDRGTMSCGCQNAKASSERNTRNLSGMRFGRLIVLQRAVLPGERGKSRHSSWVCQCDCGAIHVVQQHHLVAGSTVSCGCFRIEQTKERLRRNTGVRHPRWNHTLTAEERDRRRSKPRIDTWRVKVFERDSYTCQVCGQVGGPLCAHHINGWSRFPKQRFLLRNGVTVCKPCHLRYHGGTGWRASSTRKNWKIYLKECKDGYRKRR